MTQQFFYTILYGVIFISLVYLVVRMLYSVEYTPGSTVVYNSPIAQKLFPNEPNKLFPTWGYGSSTPGIGELDMPRREHTKLGQGKFWPKSGAGYKPSRFGSGGPSPSGGMRSAGIGTDFTSVGYWGGDITYPERQVFDIYANDAEIPEKTVWSVGWWGDSIF